MGWFGIERKPAWSEGEKAKTIMWRFGLEYSVIKLAKEIYDCINEIKKCDYNKEFRKDIQIDGYPIRELVYSISDDEKGAADINITDLEYPVVRANSAAKGNMSICIHEAKHYQQGVSQHIDKAEYRFCDVIGEISGKNWLLWHISPVEIDAMITEVIYEYVEHKTCDRLNYAIDTYNSYMNDLADDELLVTVVSSGRIRIITVDELRYELTRARDLLIELKSTIKGTGVRIDDKGYYVNLPIEMDMVILNSTPERKTKRTVIKSKEDLQNITNSYFDLGVFYYNGISVYLTEMYELFLCNRDQSSYLSSYIYRLSKNGHIKKDKIEDNITAYTKCLEAMRKTLKPAMLHNTFNYTQS